MKKLKAFFAIALTVITLTQTRPAQATVGALVATPILIAGLYVTGVGAGVTTFGLIKCGQNAPSDRGLCRLALLFVGIPVVVLGLVILDGEQGVEFQELSNAQGENLGVSASELAIYNSELDQANMLLAEVKSELSKLEAPSEKDSFAAWNNVRDLVSPETFSTMQKIVSQQ